MELENMRLTVWETPGHTPEHVSYVVSDQNRGSTPVGVFTGDTLFVGDVGRPDLFPGRAAELAEKLYHSLHRKLLTLPDHCEVYPAHGAGSLCGRSMGAKWQTTIGYERLCNSALKIAGVADFIRSLTSAMPPAPDQLLPLQRHQPPRPRLSPPCRPWRNGAPTASPNNWPCPATTCSMSGITAPLPAGASPDRGIST